MFRFLRVVGPPMPRTEQVAASSCGVAWCWHVLVWRRALNPIFLPRVLKLIFRPRGPSKQVGDVFECIWGVFCIEVACANVLSHCTITKVETLQILIDLAPIGDTIYMNIYKHSSLFLIIIKTEHTNIAHS